MSEHTIAGQVFDLALHRKQHKNEVEIPSSRSSTPTFQIL